MRLAQAALATGIWLALTGVASADAAWSPPACTPPGPPPPETMRPAKVGVKPTLPACVNPTTHLGNCRHGEVERFNAAIARYNTEVGDWNTVSGQYVDALNGWSRAADRYAQCEVEDLNTQTPR